MEDNQSSASSENADNVDYFEENTQCMLLAQADTGHLSALCKSKTCIEVTQSYEFILFMR